MRIMSANPRSRVLTLVVALLALAVLPAVAGAAPKKVRFSFTSSVASVDEGAGTYNLTVVRSLNTRVTGTVQLAVDPSSTAVAGVDYDFTSPGTITFNPGETRKTFPVTIHDDSTFNRPNKKVVFKLSSATPAGAQLKNNPLTLTILDNDGPGTIDFSQSSYSVVESAGAATVTVSRNGNPLIPESVDYATADGTATAGSDYTATSGTLTFGVGEMSKTFQVAITDDQLYELPDPETLTVTLSNAKNLNSSDPSLQPNLGPNTPTTLNIEDDDVPTFSFSSPTYSVGEANTTIDVTVNRGGATYVPADVEISDLGTGTATAGSDYTAFTPTSLHFDAGQISKKFTITIKDDALNEGNETVDLQLKQNGTQVDTAQLSIIDDDNPLPSVQFSAPTYNTNEADPTVTVTATLTRPVDGDVTVHYATADGSATNGPAPNTDGTADYQSASGTLTFKGNISNGGTGETSKTITITLNPDTVQEDDETFTVGLSAPVSGAVIGSPNTATVTIADDDSTGTLDFSAQRFDVNETAGTATITVNRTGGSAGPASVDYSTSDGTAQAPGDYTASSGTLNFADGETQHTFQVPIVWDGRQEGDETVSIALSNFNSDDDPSAVKAAVLHIADSGASGPVQFSASAYSVAENGGAATITVNRSGGSLGGPVTVDYATSDGTAHAGTDYTATTGTLTFGPGEASKAFQVPVHDDTVHQGGRALNLKLSNPGGGTSLGATATSVLNISDNELVSSPSKDKTPPRLKVTAKKLQRALELKRFTLKVHSNEAARLAITIRVRKGAKTKKLVVAARASKKVGKGKTVTIRVKLNKAALAKLRHVIAGGKVRIRLSVKGTDAAGNSATVVKPFTIR